MRTSENVALRALACACTAGVLLSIGAIQATAATPIGQLEPGTPSTSCVGQSSWVQSAQAGAPSYVVPAGQWVLVSWSHRANSAAGRELGVRVWRTTSTAGTYTLAGSGELRTLAPGGINTFYERIPVSGGGLLGLRVGNPPTGPFPDHGGGASCGFTVGAGAGDSIRYGVAASESPPGSISALSAVLNPHRLNITARLEADADADGFGDETQDSCVGTAGSASGCTPSSPSLAKDATPPSARLSGRRDSIRDGRVSFWITASEAVSVTARGTVQIAPDTRVHRLRTATAHAAAHSRVRITLRLSKQTMRAARRALRRWQRLPARISVTVRDAAGNRGTAKLTLRLKS